MMPVHLLAFKCKWNKLVHFFPLVLSLFHFLFAIYLWRIWRLRTNIERICTKPSPRLFCVKAFQVFVYFLYGDDGLILTDKNATQSIDKWRSHKFFSHWFDSMTFTVDAKEKEKKRVSVVKHHSLSIKWINKLSMLIQRNILHFSCLLSKAKNKYNSWFFSHFFSYRKEKKYSLSTTYSRFLMWC